MEFTSLAFALFLAVVAPIYHFGPARFRVALLFLASAFFYAWWSPKYAILLLGASTFAYLSGMAIGRVADEHVKSRRVQTVVAIFVLFLGVFKYLPPSAGIIAPLGISYYTFKLISYIIDIGWGKIQPEQSWLRFTTYVIFFPQIVAGPIQRAVSFLPQVEPPPAVTAGMVSEGLQRILLGLMKKMIVADNLASIVDQVYAQPESYVGPSILIAIYLYPIQLYMDFSGLTDMAVGTAALFGIRSPENFDAPFGAKNISEFWRRWHMTLTTWLTDYVFNPLRMMLRNYGNIGLVLSITVNMLLIGIWHGPHWGYAVFGFVHAIFLSIDALSTRWRKKFFSRHPFWRALATPMGVVLTWHLVIFAEIFFRAELMSTAMIVLRGIPESLMRMRELPVHLANLGRWPILVGGMGFLLIEGYNLLRRAKWLPVSFGQLPWPVRWACYYAAIYLVIEWGTYGKQFIYFKF